MSRWADLEPLFQDLSDGIVVSGAGGAVLYMNPAAERLLEVERGTPRAADACASVCGKLYDDRGEPCIAHCPLRTAGSPEKDVCFIGRRPAASSYAWRDFQVRRSQGLATLRVRCLRLGGSEEPEEHVTLIRRIPDAEAPEASP